MFRFKHFIKTSFIGGILILLPIAILAAGLNWLFLFVTDLIQPLTDFVVGLLQMPELLGDILVIGFIAILCFVIGSIVSTSLGKWAHQHFDKYLTRLAPGYRLIKEVIDQFFGDKANSPFANGEVAKAKIFGGSSETTVTAIVTSKHDDGSYTVFVPTGPNPTSGNMYHLKASQVELFPGIKVEEMMRSIIACGAGSGELFKQKSR